MSNYVVETVEALLNDDFVIIPKSLAAAIGDREAMIVKQIWSWCKHNQKRKDKQHFKYGHYWTYNSYEEWVNEFPWLSKATIQRKILKLEKMGVLISDRVKAYQNDQTKWYRVDVVALYKICKLGLGTTEEDERSHQNDVMDDRKMMRTRPHQNDVMSCKKNNVQSDATAPEDCLRASSSAHAQKENKWYTLPSGKQLERKWVSPVFLKYLELGIKPQVRDEDWTQHGLLPVYFDPVDEEWAILDYLWMSDTREDLSDNVIDEFKIARMEALAASKRRRKSA